MQSSKVPVTFSKSCCIDTNQNVSVQKLQAAEFLQNPRRIPLFSTHKDAAFPKDLSWITLDVKGWWWHCYSYTSQTALTTEGMNLQSSKTILQLVRCINILKLLMWYGSVWHSDDLLMTTHTCICQIYVIFFSFEFDLAGWCEHVWIIPSDTDRVCSQWLLKMSSTLPVLSISTTQTPSHHVINVKCLNQFAMPGEHLSWFGL